MSEQPTRLCKNCEYFESWHGWPRGDCDHPTHEVAVEVGSNGTCEKFKPMLTCDREVE